MARETELQVATRLADALVGQTLPRGMHAAIFVFREDVEVGRLYSGFIAGVQLGQLRRWIRTWLKNEKPKKETVQ